MTTSGSFPSVHAVPQEDIASTFDVMVQLRPHLERGVYLATVSRMMADGFRLAAVYEGGPAGAGGAGGRGGRVVAVAGYRLGESLVAGRNLYVDDLVTAETERSRGYGKLLLDWLKAEARAAGCRELHLDSGVQRHDAHRFYLRERMHISSYHFRLSLE
jgi:GNAT superfamily N-acetyltransferase